MEFGIFTDEGCIEAGFFSRDAAEAVRLERYAGEVAAVHEICPDHEEQPRDACEDCDSDDEDGDEP